MKWDMGQVICKQTQQHCTVLYFTLYWWLMSILSHQGFEFQNALLCQSKYGWTLFHPHQPPLPRQEIDTGHFPFHLYLTPR